MADTILQCDGIAESGLKLFLYALPGATGTPTAAGYSLAAVSGVPGRYTATVADALVGDFLVFVHDDQTEADAGTGNYGPGYVTLADDTSTYVVGGDNGLSSFAKADVNAEVDTAISDAALPAATADAIWDEAYADHTSAGTFGKLMDILRKANLSVDGTVAGTPTVNTFDTDLTDPTSTHKHQLLVFTSGALEGVSRPILSYSSTNGQIVLQEDLPSAPSASDEFTILIQHIHPVSEIQSGLATTTDVTDSEAVITGILATIASYIDTEVAAIKAKTDNLPADPATETTLATLDNLIDAIKAVTDQFVFTVPNQVDANALSGGGTPDAAAIRAAIGMAAADLDSQLDTITSKTDLIGTASALTSLLAGSVLEAGQLTGFPANLRIGDSYTDENGRSIQVYLVDEDNNPVTTIGSLDPADATVAFTLQRVNDCSSNVITGVATYFAGGGEPYVIIELTAAQTALAKPEYTYAGKLKFSWSGTSDVYTFETDSVVFVV